MRPAHLKFQAADFAEVALPAFAGAAHVLRLGGQRGLVDSEGHGLAAMLWPGGALICLLILALGSVAGRVRDMSTAAILLGAAPVVAGSLALQPGAATLSDPVLWCLAIPFAMWCGSVRVVASPRPDSRNVYRIANTLPMVALAIPVIQGEVHWGIVVLPFAVFRIASSTADKVRPGKAHAVGLAEAHEITRRTQWIGGAWVAAWAGVGP
jgi:hypothetical protein